MADKAISELVRASIITAADLFVMQQDNTAKCLPGQVLLNWLTAAADGHGGIADWKKIDTRGLVDTYRVTMADTTTFDYYVTNGKAISSVEQTSVSGLTRTYTIAFNDGTTQQFTVTDGRAISSVKQTAVSSLTRTYTISFNDGTAQSFEITDGRSFVRMEKTKTNGLVDTYTIFCNDGSTETLTVTNGEKGDKGDRADIWVRYASQSPTESSHNFGELPDTWIGIASGHNMDAAPTDWQQYTWYQWKGDKGDPGDPATLVSSEIRYQAGDSGTILPSGSWLESIPAVTPGKFLWTRQVVRFNTGAPITSYSVSRFGIDGSGAVSTVAGVAPDPNGNVPLTADDVKALPNGGGTMNGPINMNGQPIEGLNAPTNNNQAANMGFVNEQMKKAAPYNYAHNSDFTQFVAQAGVGGKHGIQSYAGDRWILNDGTVTGDAREDGNGYRNIKLNGTIRQKVANAPDNAHVAIEMISGTANSSYNNGEITITSSGGIIKNVLLCTAETLPEYRPRGYATELADCQRYFYKFDADANGMYFCAVANSDQIPGFLFHTEMHVAPTSNIIDLNVWDTRGFTSLINSISSKRATKGGFQYIQLTEKLPNNGSIAMIAEFLADIEEE